MGHGWERGSSTENERAKWERAQKGNQRRWGFCRSLNKKSPRPELGDWKERRRKGARERELTNITVQGRTEAPSFPG